MHGIRYVPRYSKSLRGKTGSKLMLCTVLLQLPTELCLAKQAMVPAVVGVDTLLTARVVPVQAGCVWFQSFWSGGKVVRRLNTG